MKKRLRTFVSALCALALTVTPAFAAGGDDASASQGAPLTTQDVSSGEMTAAEYKTKEVDGGKRIDSFKLGDLYSYESLGNDTGKPTLTLSASTLQRVVKEKLLPQWSPVAASVFRDQAGQLVDLYGYQPSGGNMSQAGFDAYFNMGKGGAPTEYKDEIWSCYNLSSKLSQTHASHAGDPGWDQFTVSGVRQVNSLSGARNMVGQALYDCENHKGLKADEFLGVSEGSNGETRLDALQSEDQTTGFANLVTSVNCKGASADFDYVSFGIVFYDFEPVPIAAKNLKYITGGFSSATDPKPGGQPSEITNGQQQDIVHSALLGDSVTETTSTTLSGLASFKMSENIGANIGWSNTESESETSFWGGEDPGASTSTSSSTLSMGLNWGSAWEMAGALGAEQGHSKSVQVSKAVETTISLPPHTATTIEHSAATTTYNQTYQQPVILNYKVAIFAVSGDFYSGGDGGINPSSYAKQSLVIKFDTKDEETPFYGCAATDDLYSRVVTNKNVGNYDVSGDRTYSTHSTASGWSKSEDINWDNVMSTAQSYYGANVVSGVAQKNFFCETPGKLSAERDKASSSAQSIYPLYNLASVKTPKTNYVLYSNNTLDRSALSVQGYDKEDVPFYGFTSEWGEWCLCDEKGNVVDGGGQQVEDLVTIEGDKLVPKAGTNGGTIYLKWVAKQIKVKTSESPDGQDLTSPQIESPVVTIKVVNVGLDNPKVTAKGSYTGYYDTPINLNDVMTYEVADSTDKIIETQVKWESREPVSQGIDVNEGTGKVTFTRPGTYNVRPYVINNGNKKVYSEWLTVTATEHDLVHYDAKDPTCTTDGWKEHYRCSKPDCGKYFSDAAGSVEISEKDVFVEASGHDWGDWVTTKDASSEEPGEQQRVCKKDESHVETRNLYAVSYNMNGHGTAPERQTVAFGASATVPQEPTAAGYTFEGWYTDAACTDPYDFGTTVKDNLTLYAKWSLAKHTVAVMAVGDVYEVDGEQKVSPDAKGSITLADATEYNEDGYTYYYKEVEYGTSLSLQVKPDANYGLKNIQAITVRPDSSMGEPFTPSNTGANTYSLIMPDADVAVLASFGQVKVTFDGNAPQGANVSNVPEAQAIPYGSIPTKPTDPTAVGASGATYALSGWYTDRECTKPYLFNSALTQDTTLYAKWIQASANKYNVSYTLYDIANSDPASYTESYAVEEGSKAYDPTSDIKSLAGSDLTKAYELKKDAKTGSCWFTDESLTTPFNFETPIKAETHLYAKVVPRTFTVKYFDGDTKLGEKEGVAYNTAIGTLGIDEPTRDGVRFNGWATKDGTPWSIDNSPVTSDLDLYAQWSVNRFSVSFDANGYGTAPATQEVEQGGKATDPGALEEEGQTFGGWFTDQACTDGNEYSFADTAVTDNLTLYAKWTAVEYTVKFEANGHGTAPDAQTVAHGGNATKPSNPTAEGQTFGGWFTDADCTTPYSFSDPVTGDLTLFAKWTAERYTVKFEANGHGTAPAAQEVEHGGKATDPGSLEEEGQAFGGWYTDADCTARYDFSASVTGDLTLYAKWGSLPEPGPAPAEGLEMYRLYNPYTGEHFYTASVEERYVLYGAGWSYEGVAWVAPAESSTPVYRLYNPYAGDHHYTTSAEERDYLVSAGWSDEGIGWYSADGGVPLWRQYNPNAVTGAHNYTTSVEERDMLVSVGWHHEGVGWYGLDV